MNYPPKSVALTFAGGKDAALYFDYIVPLTHAVFEMPRLTPDGDSLRVSVGLDSLPSPELFQQFLPTPLKEWRNPYDIINMFQMLAGGFGRELGGIVPTLTDTRSVDIALPRAPEVFRMIPEAAVRSWIKYLSECHAEGSLSFMVGASTPANDAVASPSVVLSNLELVNADACSLEQIVEFRKDVHSQRQLRRLLMFVYSNYKDKPIAYIEDDIQQRIQDHATAVKLWGFQTKTGALKCILNDKIVAALGTTALWAALIGDTQAIAIGAAVSSIGIAAGKLGAYIAEQKNALVGLRGSNSVAYLIDAKSALEPSAT